jgi:hypothetical protein
MENKRIVYQNEYGGVSVIIPAADCRMTVEQKAATYGLGSQEYMDQAREAGLTPKQFIDGLVMTVEQIAEKDVPTGLSYKIVDVLDIPTDRTERNQWFIDLADLTDGVGK